MEDPTNRIVAVFANKEFADAARNDLSDYGIQERQIRILEGKGEADEVDTSAKWFADTDEEMEQFQQQLLAGNTVISVPAKDKASREEIHEILKRHDAYRVTHFGRWVTELMR